MAFEMNSVIKIETIKEQPLSKLQKQFNTFTSKIEKLKAELIISKELVDTAKKSIKIELNPLYGQLTEAMLSFIEVLDRQHDDSFFKKAEKKLIAAIILENAQNLVFEHSNEKAVSYFEKYSNTTLEEVNEEVDADEKDYLLKYASFIGFELDENLSIEEMKERIKRKLEENEEEFEKAKRPKSEASKKRDEKKKDEKNKTELTARKVYMELVKEFHPDREKDEDERIRKTDILQGINEAYNKKDLFQLLKLQSDYLQKNKEFAKNLADEKLKYYNKILKTQIDNLEAELLNLKGHEFDRYSFFNTYCLNEAQLGRELKKDKRKLKNIIKQARAQLDIFRDKDALKEFLKVYKKGMI